MENRAELEAALREAFGPLMQQHGFVGPVCLEDSGAVVRIAFQGKRLAFEWMMDRDGADCRVVGPHGRPYLYSCLASMGRPTTRKQSPAEPTLREAIAAAARELAEWGRPRLLENPAMVDDLPDSYRNRMA